MVKEAGVYLKTRKIKLGLFTKSAIVYRLSVIAMHSIFFFIVTGKIEMALGASITINVMNTIWYYIYHLQFARMFKIGEDIDE